MALKVLVADDEDFILDFLETVFSEIEGFEIVALCRDGEEAVSKATETDPDVCLLDVKMPKQDGIEACRRIRDRFPDMLVVMISGLANDEYVTRAKEAGARDFLPKPFKIHEIEEVLARNAREVGLLA